MSLQVEKLEKNMAKLTIEASAEDFEKAIQKAISEEPEEESTSRASVKVKHPAQTDRENVRHRAFSTKMLLTTLIPECIRRGTGGVRSGDRFPSGDQCNPDRSPANPSSSLQRLL